MPPPTGPPIGLRVTQTAKAVSRAFEHALAEAGGTIPTWLVLLSLKTGHSANQRELAEAVGVQDATLTHHLNAMEAGGLVTRTRDPENRRVHRVGLTDAGEAAFDRMRSAAAAFDRRLRMGITSDETAGLEKLLDRLRDNAHDDVN